MSAVSDVASMQQQRAASQALAPGDRSGLGGSAATDASAPECEDAACAAQDGWDVDAQLCNGSAAMG